MRHNRPTGLKLPWQAPEFRVHQPQGRDPFYDSVRTFPVFYIQSPILTSAPIQLFSAEVKNCDLTAHQNITDKDAQKPGKGLLRSFSCNLLGVWSFQGAFSTTMLVHTRFKSISY